RVERRQATSRGAHERLQLISVERQCKGSLEHCQPGRPGADVAQLGAEQAFVAQDFIDRERRHVWCSRMMSFNVRPVSRGTLSMPRRCDNRTVVDASVQSVATSTASPLIIFASISSLCTVTAASRRSRPSLMSLHWSAPPMSVMKALTRSRKRRAALDVPLTPGNRSLWFVTRARNRGADEDGTDEGRAADDSIGSATSEECR